MPREGPWKRPRGEWARYRGCENPLHPHGTRGCILSRNEGLSCGLLDSACRRPVRHAACRLCAGRGLNKDRCASTLKPSLHFPRFAHDLLDHGHCFANVGNTSTTFNNLMCCPRRRVFELLPYFEYIFAKFRCHHFTLSPQHPTRLAFQSQTSPGNTHCRDGLRSCLP